MTSRGTRSTATVPPGSSSYGYPILEHHIAGNHVYWNGDDGIMSGDSITAITNNLVTDNAGTGHLRHVV